MCGQVRANFGVRRAREGVMTANPAERHSGLSRDRVGQGRGAPTLIHLTLEASMKESVRRS